MFSALLLGAAGASGPAPTSIDLLAAGLPQEARLPWALGWVGLLIPILEEAYFPGSAAGAVMRFVGGSGRTAPHPRPQGLARRRGGHWRSGRGLRPGPPGLTADAGAALDGPGAGGASILVGLARGPDPRSHGLELGHHLYGLYPGVAGLRHAPALPGAMWLSVSLLVHYRSVMGLGRATP